MRNRKQYFDIDINKELVDSNINQTTTTTTSSVHLTSKGIQTDQEKRTYKSFKTKYYKVVKKYKFLQNKYQHLKTRLNHLTTKHIKKIIKLHKMKKFASIHDSHHHHHRHREQQQQQRQQQQQESHHRHHHHYYYYYYSHEETQHKVEDEQQEKEKKLKIYSKLLGVSVETLKLSKHERITTTCRNIVKAMIPMIEKREFKRSSVLTAQQCSAIRGE